MVLATSLADCTKCLLATGLAVLDDARRQALQRAEVCLATIVAADRTYSGKYNHEKHILSALSSKGHKIVHLRSKYITHTRKKELYNECR